MCKSHVGESLFTEPPCMSVVLWQVSVAGLLCTFKNILISLFECMISSWQEAMRELQFSREHCVWVRKKGKMTISIPCITFCKKLGSNESFLPVKNGTCIAKAPCLSCHYHHFTPVSCCRCSTCVISSDSYSLSETGPSYYYKLLSKQFCLMFVNCTSDTSKYYKMCVFHT